MNKFLLMKERGDTILFSDLLGLIGRMSGWKKLNKPLARQGKRL